MNLLLDENLQSRLLVQLLRAGGHDVKTVEESGMHSSPDPDVFLMAQQEHRVILTKNVSDFTALHYADPVHCGIALVHEGQDRKKNMREPDIARAVGNLEASRWDFSGQCVSLNDWNFEPLGDKPE